MREIREVCLLLMVALAGYLLGAVAAHVVCP